MPVFAVFLPRQAVEFTIHRFKTTWGEEIEIRETPSGETVCPVCGGIFGGDWPWGEYYECDSHGNPIGETYGAASFDGCPCCLTHYGDEDWPKEGETLNETWEKLRKKWLDQVALTPEVKSQLANLGTPAR